MMKTKVECEETVSGKHCIHWYKWNIPCHFCGAKPNNKVEVRIVE